MLPKPNDSGDSHPLTGCTTRAITRTSVFVPAIDWTPEMTLIEHAAVDQGSDAWFDLRRGMLTASTIGQLITPKTIKPASNPESRALTAQLVAERITGYTDPTYMSDDMMRGHDDEPRAIDKYAEHYGREVRTTGFLVREEDGWRLGCSPDALVGADGAVEVKAPRAKKHLQTILADEVPLEHMPQCQTVLFVTGRDWLDFISYSGGLPMYVKGVVPDEQWFEAIAATVEAFETTAAQMIAAYGQATKGLAQTERVEYGLVEMKL